MAYVRILNTASATTAVRVVWFSRRESRNIELGKGDTLLTVGGSSLVTTGTGPLYSAMSLRIHCRTWGREVSAAAASSIFRNGSYPVSWPHFVCTQVTRSPATCGTPCKDRKIDG